MPTRRTLNRIKDQHRRDRARESSEKPLGAQQPLSSEEHGKAVDQFAEKLASASIPGKMFEPPPPARPYIEVRIQSRDPKTGDPTIYEERVRLLTHKYDIHQLGKLFYDAERLFNENTGLRMHIHIRDTEGEPNAETSSEVGGNAK